MTKFSDLYAKFGRPALEHTFGEQVTYKARRTDTAGAAEDIGRVISGAIRMEEHRNAQSVGFASQQSAGIVWRLPKSALDAYGITPQRGDTFEDSSENTWTIQSWRLTGQGTIYEFEFHKGTI